ncbi:MAG: endolytic transglycosylase MltG [Coriobacteriia bacterium]|nr:endolytic transglycosylase MltG [Coriobacteriia bacterium]
MSKAADSYSRSENYRRADSYSRSDTYSRSETHRRSDAYKGSDAYRRPAAPRISGPDVNAVRLVGITERKRPSIVKTILLGLVLVAAAIGLAFGGVKVCNIVTDSEFNWFGIFDGSNVKPGEPVTVTIIEGATTNEIAKLLKDKGVINSEQAFKTRAFERGADTAFKPGTYELTTGMDLDELITALVTGPVYINASTRLTIPEGWRVELVALRVQNVCGIPAEDFLELAYSADVYAKDYPFLEEILPELYNNSLEGFLYPKTYDIPRGATADTVIRILLNQFVIEIEAAGLDLTYANSKNMSLYDVIIAASLIERETADFDERPLIASVIYNRLRIDMPLQIDATVIYVLGLEWEGPDLYYSDLEIDSPYNTYKYYGLPAGPICSSHISSIEAAANPTETNYLFYVLKKKGEKTHNFYETYDDFLGGLNDYNNS